MKNFSLKNESGRECVNIDVIIGQPSGKKWHSSIHFVHHS